ncbi:SDR family oxidoreductase [Bacteriovoracaceae bacterium]|nr:SDR family oxidoreductase [Bacteriovoracaceae bacterium]
MNKQIVTIITGTSRGIGQYLCKYYLNMGHKVIGCSRSDNAFKHPNYTHFLCEVSKEEEIKKVFEFIQEKDWKLSHLINNAAIASMNHSLLTPANTASQVLDTNVVGTFLFCREAARLMKKNEFGRIINFSSIAVSLHLEGESIYAASKAAINTLTQVLAHEFAPFGITVNALSPAPIATDLIRNVPKEKIEELIKKQAVKRMGTFEDISNIINFYFSEKSDFITGQNISLGGIV